MTGRAACATGVLSELRDGEGEASAEPACRVSHQPSTAATFADPRHSDLTKSPRRTIGFVAMIGCSRVVKK